MMEMREVQSATRDTKLLGVIERLFRILIASTSILLMLLFIVTALRRVQYPYELKQLEGYMFLSTLRAYNGQSIYPRPSLAFVPYMYPPVYYYVAAALGKVMGMTISTLRTVSILSTLGSFAMIYLLVWREAKRFLPAIVAVGIYAGCYPLCQNWFDEGRLDSLFVFLVLIALLASRQWHPVVAGGAGCWPSRRNRPFYRRRW